MTDKFPKSSGPNPISLTLGVMEHDRYIGECIYCGSKDNLSDEHPIPYGLWGKSVLGDGSCAACARETSKIEAEILRGSLGGVREYFASPSRRSKKKNLRTGVVSLQGDSGESLKAPVSDVVQFAVVPAFKHLPRKLLLEPKGNKHRTFSAVILPFNQSPSPETVNLWAPAVKLNITTWSRFLVKIAYGDYIRTFDEFFRSPHVSSFILTGKGDLTIYIGGRINAPAAAFLYNVTHYALRREKGGYAVVSYIRLFSFLESPSYLVHLGEIPRGEALPTGLPIYERWSASELWPTYDPGSLIDFVPKGATWRPMTD